jgi:spore coat polysaccharide biosynthesis protein SpsF
MTSTRLPGKALKPLAGKSALYHEVQRLRAVQGITEIYLATSRNPANGQLIDEALRLDVKCYEGAEEDLVDRYIRILELEKADVAVRCGGDKPLFSIEFAQQSISGLADHDYVYCADQVSVGAVTELLSLRALEETHKYYSGTAIAQHIRENMHKFRTLGLHIEEQLCRPEYRVALDTPEDYEMLSIVYRELYSGFPIPLKEVYLFLDDNPDVANINRLVKKKAVNLYSEDLLKRPVFSISKTLEGKYVIRDALGQPFEYEAFKKLVDVPDDWA